MAEVDLEKAPEEKKRMPGNAYTQIEPRKTDIQPAEQSQDKKKPKAKEKKRTFGERIAENFLNMDHEQIRERLLFDWLFPEIINTFDDILRMIFFGDRNGGSRRRNRERGSSGYNSIYDERKRERERERSDATRQNFKRIRLVFYTRDDANEVLDELRESLADSSGGYVTVRELYSLADMPTNYSMNKWGWYDLEDAMITRDREDYILEMPKAEVIER